MKRIKQILSFIIVSLVFTNFVSAQAPIFKREKTIKGEKSEYYVYKPLPSISGVIISNKNNTLGTPKFPERTQDVGGGMYTKENFIHVYKIIKEIIPENDFRKLLNEEKIPFHKSRYDQATIDKISKSSVIMVNVLFYPVSGKVAEVFFTINGKVFENLSPDYYEEIENRIKKEIVMKSIIESKWQYYILSHFEYHFNDLDTRTINGERIILSDIN